MPGNGFATVVGQASNPSQDHNWKSYPLDKFWLWWNESSIVARKRILTLRPKSGFLCFDGI
jgi:hypothetical protein